MSKRATMDIEMGLPNADTTSADGPKSYSQEVTEFRMFLDNTAKLVHKLKEATQEFNSATESAAMREIKGRMEKDSDEVGKMAHIMKEKLRIMLLKDIDSTKNSGCKDIAIDIARMALTISLKTRIKVRKSDFQNLAETIRQEYLHVIQRRIFTVTGIKLSDEVIRVIDTGSVVQMFEKAVQGISAEQMVAAVDEINEWRVAATDFDKKFLGVQKNFDHMAALVDAGEKLDKAVALNKLQKLCDERDENERGLWDERDKNDRHLATVICLGLGLLFFFAYVIIVVAFSG